MGVIYLLIGFSLLIALLFLGLFIWAVKNGQFDDTHTPSIRILFDNKPSDGTKQTPKNEAED